MRDQGEGEPEAGRVGSGTGGGNGSDDGSGGAPDLGGAELGESGIGAPGREGHAGAGEWTYAPPADLAQPLAERLKGFPREPEMWMYALRSGAAAVIRAWLGVYHRFRIHGREHLPTAGSFVMVGNHESHLDAPCLLAALPWRTLHRAFPAAAADYFFQSLPTAAFSSIVINALPFDREAKGAESLAVCRALLETPGNVLILFPEGTRSTTGELGRFRSGIGRLVEGTDVPVVPCRLVGAHRAWPKGAAIPRPAKLDLHIGAPRSFGHLQPGRETVGTICRELQEAVAGLG